MLCWDLSFFATQKVKSGSNNDIYTSLANSTGFFLIPLKWCALLFSLKVYLRASKMVSYIFWVYRKRAEKFTWGSIRDLASHLSNFGLENSWHESCEDAEKCILCLARCLRSGFGSWGRFHCKMGLLRKEEVEFIQGWFQGLPRPWDPFMVSGTHTIPISLGILDWEWD